MTADRSELAGAEHPRERARPECLGDDGCVVIGLTEEARAAAVAGEHQGTVARARR